MDIRKDFGQLILQVYIWAGRPTKDGAKDLRNLAAMYDYDHALNADNMSPIVKMAKTQGNYVAPTLDEYFADDQFGRKQLLVQNLKTNIEVYGDGLSQKEKADLLRMNLIMVRQCMEEYGVK